MNKKPLQSLAALAAAITIAGCAPGDGGGDMNILDAAALFEANPEAFVSIRKNYPGPFNGFVRIPARNPADETPEAERFIKSLREKIPVEFVDFFPLGDTGKDEIDVIIKRYSSNTGMMSIGLIFSELPLSSPDKGQNMMYYDRCDQRSLAWIESGRDEGSVTALCRINNYWYAYQRVD